MSQDPELGRPNYTAGPASQSSARPGQQSMPTAGPRRTLEPRAVQAALAAVVAWSSWTNWYHLPIVVAFLASIFAVLRGRRCESSLGRVAGFLGLINLVFVTVLLAFLGQRDGVAGILDLLFT